jgi:hypothetical protein
VAAQTNPAACTNDIDCVATPQCGGDICDWVGTPGQMKCKAAGSYPVGMDGWCMADTDCKCHSLGATCDLGTLRCTFTRPCGAPDAGPCATGGTSGGTGTAGTSGGGGGGGGCNIASTTPAVTASLLVALGLLAFARRRRQ